jgi:1-acyl-sn-glycerol-3-phosphate acyltransferase
MSSRWEVPVPGAQIERWGNAFTRGFGRLVLGLWGWKIENQPPNKAKWVGVVAPHTSNVDFFVGMAAILAMGLRAHWMAKHTLFRPRPVKWLLEALGGIPVDREQPIGVVEQVVAMFDEREHLVLGVTPEGTRKRVENWKTGFHRIARTAGVPIQLVSFDYGRKALTFGLLIEPSEDLECDMRLIRDYFSTVTAKRPERFALPPVPVGKTLSQEQPSR